MGADAPGSTHSPADPTATCTPEEASLLPRQASAARERTPLPPLASSPPLPMSPPSLDITRLTAGIARKLREELLEQMVREFNTRFLQLQTELTAHLATFD
ncbi:uncharacterized protein Tco025E_03219, partial [Trypanosoma conorhini]